MINATAQFVLVLVTVEHTNRRTRQVTSTAWTLKEDVMNNDPTTDEPLAQVHIEGQHVVNLGNYESLRVTVGVTLPVPLTQVGATIKDLSQRLPGRIERAVNHYLDNSGLVPKQGS